MSYPGGALITDDVLRAKRNRPVELAAVLVHRIEIVLHVRGESQERVPGFSYVDIDGRPCQQRNAVRPLGRDAVACGIVREIDTSIGERRGVLHPEDASIRGAPRRDALELQRVDGILAREDRARIS